jgi:hypothetical protein
VTDPLHPIGPRDRDIEPVRPLPRLARRGDREAPDPEHEEPPHREHSAERHPDPVIEQPPPPEIDDGNPHIDVRV